MSALISIITVTKDDADGLARTLDSIRHQSVRDFESVVVFAHSGDHTANVIEANADLIAVSEQDEGAGIYSAMNQAIDRASGKWLYFLNSGDTLLPEALAQCATYLRASSAAVVYGSVIRRGTEWLPKPLDQMWKGSCICHQGAFIASSALQAGYDTSYRILADYNLFAGLYASGNTFQQMPVQVANYAPDGISARPTIQKTKEYIRASRIHFPSCPGGRHQITTYLRQKTHRGMWYVTTEIFWSAYHQLRIRVPKTLRSRTKRLLSALITKLRGQN